MKLTAILMRWKKKPPGGHMWRGKYRLYKEVKHYHLSDLRANFDREEKNLFYLRHPYLTIEQSYGHGKALGHREEFLHKMATEKLKWKDHEYLGDRLGFLKVGEKWE